MRTSSARTQRQTRPGAPTAGTRALTLSLSLSHTHTHTHTCLLEPERVHLDRLERVARCERDRRLAAGDAPHVHVDAVDRSRDAAAGVDRARRELCASEQTRVARERKGAVVGVIMTSRQRSRVRRAAATTTRDSRRGEGGGEDWMNNPTRAWGANEPRTKAHCSGAATCISATARRLNVASTRQPLNAARRSTRTHFTSGCRARHDGQKISAEQMSTAAERARMSLRARARNTIRRSSGVHTSGVPPACGPVWW